MELSLREDEAILTLITNDCGVKQVADKMFISDRTAQKHFENAKKKNKVNTLAGLVFMYLKSHKELLASFLLILQINTMLNDPYTDLRKGKSKTKISRTRNVRKQ